MRDYATIVELAERLHVSRHTIYTWVSQRRIPFLKIGRLLRFDLDAVERWLIEKSRPEETSSVLEAGETFGVRVRGRGPRPERRSDGSL
jgi:excisionase family DNA binding protein